MKTFGIAALAALVALVLGFSVRAASPADATANGILSVGCELIEAGIDGDLDADVATVPAHVAYDQCSTATLAPQWLLNLDSTYGDDDGEFQLSDLDNRAELDGNQIRESCTSGGPQCTMLVFVEVDDEAPVNIDLPSGIKNLQNGAQDFTCDSEAGAPSLTTDNDCTDVADNNGDGIVVFHVVNDSADPGDEVPFNVEQENEEQDDSVNITGDPDSLTIELIEDVIQTNGSTTAADNCAEGGSDISDAAEEVVQPEKTLVVVTVKDDDDVDLARVTIFGDDSLSPLGSVDSDDDDIAIPATRESATEQQPSGTTLQTVVASAGTAFFQVICGGADTGTATLTAIIDPAPLNGVTTDQEDESIDITVVGEPDAVALTVAPATIACDGTATATVTATVTDSDGNNVANGTDVNFSVVALGTANPINTNTTDGVATSVITPLSNASAGVTVVVTAGGDADTAASIRVDCSIPIPPQPTTGPAATPTRPGGVIGGPDTGNGGYVGQDSSAGFPMWTLVALALGSVALVAGGLVTRRVGK